MEKQPARWKSLPKEEAMTTLKQAAIKVQKYLLDIGFDVDMEKVLDMLDVTFIHPMHFGNFDPVNMELRVPSGDNPFFNHIKRHELVHSIGLNRKTERIQRSGLESYNPYGYFSTDKQLVFAALNEAVVDELAYRAGGKSLLNWLSVNLGVYKRERKMLKMLCSGVAQSKKDITSDDVFAEFVGVMLNGWNRQLKQNLIGVFGPDILKVLAVIDIGNFCGEHDKSLSNKEMWNNIKIYLDLSNTEISRNIAKDKILKEYDTRNS